MALWQVLQAPFLVSLEAPCLVERPNWGVFHELTVDRFIRQKEGVVKSAVCMLHVSGSYRYAEWHIEK